MAMRVQWQCGPASLKSPKIPILQGLGPTVLRRLRDKSQGVHKQTAVRPFDTQQRCGTCKETVDPTLCELQLKLLGSWTSAANRKP